MKTIFLPIKIMHIDFDSRHQLTFVLIMEYDSALYLDPCLSDSM